MLGVLLFVTNTKVNKNVFFSFIITVGTMYLVDDFIAARAQLVTFVLFVLEILFVECFLDTKKKRYALGLMLIALLIANMHAAVFYFFFILLMPYIGEYIIIKIRDSYFWYKIRIAFLKRRINKLEKNNKKPEKQEKLQAKLLQVQDKFNSFKELMDRREANPYKIKLERRDAAKWLILIALLCFLMGMLTPIGDEPYTHIFKLMSGTTTKNISEHQPLTLANHTKSLICISLLTIIIVFTDTKISLKNLFMIGGLLVLTFMSRRQFSMLVIIGGIFFTRLIVDFTDKYDKKGIEEFMEMCTSRLGQVLSIVAILLCTFTIYVKKMNDDYINSSSYPVEMADYILEEAKNGNLNLETMKLFNDYNYGSYLLFRGIPVFIDSRADLYSPEFNEGVNIFNDYINISSIGVYYEDKFEEYGITNVISSKNSKLNMLLSRDDNYKELHSDDNFVFYERLNVENS